MTKAALPAWASEKPNGDYVIDIDLAYPALLQELADSAATLPERTEAEPDHYGALRRLDPTEPDQYWLEVVYQMAKWELRRYLLISGVSAWPGRIILKGDKSRWAQRLHRVGRGVEAASRGGEARDFYRRLRGFIPN